jgi:hypothetical protein
MSDSEDASALPTDAQIESTLKLATARKFKTDLQNLSVKSVRKAVENELDLPDGWLKQHGTWKEKSSHLIGSEFERLDQAGVADSEDDDNEPVLKKTTKRGSGTSTAINTKKRKSAEEPKKTTKAQPKPRKKRKVSSEEEDEASESEAVRSVSDNEISSPVAKRKTVKPKANPRNVRSKAVVDSDSEDDAADNDALEDVRMSDASVKDDAPPQEPEKKHDSDDDEDQDDAPATKAAAPVDADGNGSESDMSVLIDEPPAKKKRQKKSPPAKASKSKSTTKSKPAAKKETKEVTPDDEEIKRLQGWLVKCGVRKVWGKELKPFETPKAKIAHLKSLLTDVGMTGRYSTEKASQIKEQRELAADLEAVTDFDKKWGQKEEKRSTGAKDLGIDPSLLDDSDDE